MKKTILITGGAKGIGKRISFDFAKAGYNVCINYNKSKSEAMLLKDELAKDGCSVVIYKADITKNEEVHKMVNDVINTFGKIDVLINNAGLWIQEELDYNDSDRIHSVVDVNLLGVINCSKAVIPFMKQNKTGLIININSQAGINHKAERVVYNATKWGVTGFSKSLQDEVAKYGIRVTNVMPGMMKTDMFSKMNIEKNMANGVDTKEVARLIQFIIDTPSDVMIPEVGIKNINN